jgi:DNA invertase Pin-like site-specific DNA recombinase
MWCRREGWQVAEEYVDYVTALGSSRDDFGRLFEDARSGRFEIVLFITLRDFLPVATRETVRRLMELDRLDVTFAALLEPELSTIGVEGHRLRRSLAILEAQQHRHIASRVRSGMARVRQEGRRVGRPRLTLEKRREILQLRQAGRSVAETARMVGVSESTVVKYQNRPTDDLLELVVRSRGR